MAETFEIMFSCSLSCILHFAPDMKDHHTWMTWKTKVMIQHNNTCDQFKRSDYGEGRNKFMVSQEQMPFMFLVMHPLPEMKDNGKATSTTPFRIGLGGMWK